MTEKLIQGFLKFRHKAYEGENALMPELIDKGQSPDYFIISCIDSRANPGTLFRTAPGMFFAHKAMGAIVRPYKQGTALAAALQFAINYNNVKDIIVLGHTKCGAVKALIDNLEDPEITSFVQEAKKGLERAEKLTNAHTHHDDLHRHAEEQIVLQSIENLMEYPSVQHALKEDRINVRAWLFDMEEPDILEYQNDIKEFKSLTQINKKESAQNA